MPRFERILFPVDFSERSRAAAPFVLSMAQRYKAKVIALHVLQPPPPLYAGMNTVYPEVYDFEGLSADLRAELEKFAEAELPKVYVTCVVETGDPAAVITEYAENEKIDLIAMPTHGYGRFRRALLGSVTAKVLHDAKVPVWTAAHAPEPSHRAHPQPRHILCAIGLKPESRHTLEFAIEMAGDANATVEALHVAIEGEAEPARAETRLHELLIETAREKQVKVQEAVGGPGVEGVVNGGSIAHMVRAMAVDKRSDLVVVGRGCEKNPLMGRLWSNTYAIVRESPCPVLSV
ncbi:MAG TPA: universal stress protein [Bryobacteraceae bacterium]|nr:universal stress protein [Bryobacteraceae bacterium]